MGTDQAWATFGQQDPYFGVLAEERFRSERLDDDAKAAFFETGERYVDHVLRLAHDHLRTPIRFGRLLDFGCGVGRLAIPFARRFDEVIGVDVSPGMLAEARSNAAAAGVGNVRFLNSGEGLPELARELDVVHSFIVFQHIRPAVGEPIFRDLVVRLRPGGVGILHVTYANGSATPRGRRWLTRAYERVPAAWGLRNVAKGQPFGGPQMEMNQYDLNRLLRILQEHGCHDLHLWPTEASHYGHPMYGVVLLFGKTAVDTRAHS